MGRVRELGEAYTEIWEGSGNDKEAYGAMGRVREL